MVARAVSRGALALLGTILLVSLATRAPAQCVGDCAGDGEVTISDLILGVNIALGNQPVSACPAFANGGDQVTIAQLIQGVNNALSGCPPPATATATHTAIAATATSTATVPAATATHTLATTPIATATATGTAIPTGTASATVTVTPTHTGVPTGTATATLTELPATPTQTAIPSGTATATLTPTHTGVPTGTATAEATPTAMPTDTATASFTPTPTPTRVPSGEPIAGRAAFISTGLGSLQSLVAAVAIAATNTGGVLASAEAIGPPIVARECPINGATTQSCGESGAGEDKTLHLVLGADNCVVPGPLGGRSELAGSITIDSTPDGANECSPPRFAGGAYDVPDLMAVLHDASNDIVLTASGDLDGTLNLTGASACLAAAFSFSVNGTLSTMLPDGTAIKVQFLDTAVTMDHITYSADCVPLKYSLTFTGDAVFTPMQEALLEVSAPLISGVATDDGFAVTFTDFVLTQDATTSPVAVTMAGTLASPCFGGELRLDTPTPLAVVAGELCPSAGEIAVTGSDDARSTVGYGIGGVTVTPEEGTATSYPSCLAPALSMCAPA
ncbi:hypothetical protein KF840_16270 [bacterium]|nr:hypothetical protein [bacterium]